jgi:hypothetical protein
MQSGRDGQFRPECGWLDLVLNWGSKLALGAGRAARGEGGHLGSANDNRGFRWRLGLWSLLIVAWLVTLLYMWTAFATFPSAERLEQSRPMPIPTLGTAAMLAARSAAELGVLLALLWPWWRRWYPGRALLAAVAAGGWFLATTPLSLSAMGWVHRRWLAAMVLLAFATFAASSAARARRWLFADDPDDREAAA